MGQVPVLVQPRGREEQPRARSFSQREASAVKGAPANRSPSGHASPTTDQRRFSSTSVGELPPLPHAGVGPAQPSPPPPAARAPPPPPAGVGPEQPSTPTPTRGAP